MNSILHPTVPFNLPIPGGMPPGKIVKVQGFIPYASNRFAINLLCGQMGDVALHVCPRFDQNCIVRNTIQKMQMGFEERSGIMPIHPGQNFEVLILCDSQNFKIAFNGQHFTEFNHRLSYSAITNIAVDGQVVIHSVHFEQNVNNSRNIGLVIPPNPSYGPGGGQPIPPYPQTGVPAGGMPYQNYSGPLYPPNNIGNPPNNIGYPPQSGYGQHNPPYPQNPVGSGGYPTNGGYPPSQQPQGSYPHSPKPHKSTGFLDKAGMAVAGVLGTSALLGGKKNKLGVLGQKFGAAMATATALTDHLNPKKAAKKQMKAHKKAMKYGLPLAGAGLGAYALHKGLHKGFHGFRHSSSSSSSSSD